MTSFNAAATATPLSLSSSSPRSGSGSSSSSSSLAPLAAGMLAGAVEGFLTYPAEYVKTRAQFAASTTPKEASPSSAGGTTGKTLTTSATTMMRKQQAAAAAVAAEAKRNVSTSIGALKGGLDKPPTSSTSPLTILRTTLRTHGLRGLYSGSGALVAGNSLKAGVRFMTYDAIKGALAIQDGQQGGRLSPGRSLLAGLGAGVCEAVVAVTPSETIKTKLIADAQRARPLYTSTWDGTLRICQSEGLAGIYRGLGPTILKQGANSAVRFTSYNTLRDAAISFSGGGAGGNKQQQLGSLGTFIVGAAAGIVTVYTTMPLDNLKTRMQTLGAEHEYRNTFHCLQRIIREEGVSRLWGGTTPRLARLSLSGGIVFVVYEAAMQAMTKI